MRTVKVSLKERSYEILIGPDVLARLGGECARHKLSGSCAIITDANVGPLYALKCQRSLATDGINAFVITIPPGETAKNLKTVQQCYDQLAARRMERRSFIVALGGGVVGDLAGFVAATYLRGLPFVQVPTTLLAQVDSSVGGKTGVNLKAGKNLVGAFHQPRLVLCDLKTLNSLPVREYRSGLAEVIKYGIIQDRRLFDQLERGIDKLLRLDPGMLGGVVARCCEIKASVVGQDETEGGLRAILNFGHTIGHALEAISGYGKYLHGEAIAIGQIGAAILSSQLVGFPQTDVERIRRLLQRSGLPVSAAVRAVKRQKLLDAMKLDKKVSQGSVKFVLAPCIGKAIFGQQVPEMALRAAMNQVLS